ncbi:MAG TPA: DUF2017 domain-containing protein [Pedococcus sp.]|nr:DUF2017 domain-containing protein [Pedococcus sp.]
MARGFKRKGGRYVAKLDPVERGVVVGLMEQVLELVAPDGHGVAGAGEPSGPAQGRGDTFDQIVAGLGGSGWGVSVSAEDQSLDAPSSPGSLGERDPALERLLPCANREDDQIAAEFRRLTEQGLRSRKAANLSTAILALANVEEQRVELGPAEAVAMVVALTDVRLVLGERLGLRTDEDLDELEAQVASLDDDDPAVYALAVYDFLTWLQETLAHALAP